MSPKQKLARKGETSSLRAQLNKDHVTLTPEKRDQLEACMGACPWSSEEDENENGEQNSSQSSVETVPSNNDHTGDVIYILHFSLTNFTVTLTDSNSFSSQSTVTPPAPKNRKKAVAEP